MAGIWGPQFSYSPNTIVDNDCPTYVYRQSLGFGFRHSGFEAAAAASKVAI